MALPLLMAGSLALGSIYTGGKAFDNFRYWSDYRGNTGFSPNYPFKSGEFDYLRNASALGFSYSGLKNLSGRKSARRSYSRRPNVRRVNAPRREFNPYDHIMEMTPEERRYYFR